MQETASLKPVSVDQIMIFKIRNRQGYAAMCLENLTEGKTPEEAFQRLLHPLRRMGHALPDRIPSLQLDEQSR
jgi:hypothetical protein